MPFIKATKQARPLRLQLSGPSGSGKTYTALELACGIVPDGGRIAVIDTEHGGSSLYSGTFDFDVSELEDHSIPALLAEIDAAAAAGYSVLIVDSLTHSYQWLVDEVDKRSAKGGDNKFQGWAWGGKLWRELIERILTYPGHCLVTTRVKTDWAMDQYTDSKGRTKTKPRKVGLKPEVRPGTDFEFDIVLELSTEHVATATKDRTGQVDGQEFERPDRSLGRKLVEWLADGETPLQLFKGLFKRIVAASDHDELSSVGADVRAQKAHLTKALVDDLAVVYEERKKQLASDTSV
jgi:hypothetical protein